MNPLLAAVWTGRWLQEMESSTGPALLPAPFSRDLDHARMPSRALRSGRAGGAWRASPRRRLVLSRIRRASLAWQSPRVFRRPPAVEAVRSWCAQGGATPRRLNGRDFGPESPGAEKVACGAADEPPASGGVDGAVGSRKWK